MLTARWHAERRAELLEQLPDNTIAVLPANPELIRNNDAEYPFRQHSNFLYLTGFNEPDALMVLRKQGNSSESILFVRPKDPAAEIWTGFRAGTEGATQAYGFDRAFTIDQIDAELPKLMDGAEFVAYPLNENKAFANRVFDWMETLAKGIRRGSAAPEATLDLADYIHEMRLVKTPEELAIMREAGRISAEGHIAAMMAAKPGCYEYQLEAEILHTFVRQGARFPAYNSIVGGGANACILHYIENNKAINDGDLVLIDAGAEVHGYAGDITRTFPVNGRFTGEQRAVYDIVLEAMKASIDELKIGNHCKTFHEKSTRILTQGMVDLGLLQGDVDGLIESGAHTRYFMHGTGHHIGLDVHDVGRYKLDGEWRMWQPGMVTTVEPGIYIQANDERAPEGFRGIGIRIEDDLVLTEAEPENLTAQVPKEADDIEALMRG
ncbi:Xaa-Pro aminopeptidase [Salinibius halmophilus]|uniref:Xaa-Pro aminopeptidase n=1 Tax=Salinibius halmophilus TaxID=1853216 RepID=UPI000E662BC8|nr:Xaa-Pro aminopeptidase [Salinibius halmophilus]